MPKLDLVKQDDEAMDGETEICAYDGNARTAYLSQVSAFVSSAQIKDSVVAIAEGLEHVIFSEPLKSKNYERVAWLEFTTDALCNTAIEKLKTI